MKVIRKILLPVLFLFIILTGCSNHIMDIGCPDGAIDWVDVVMINNIKYQHEFPDPSDEKVPIFLEKGRVLGKVTYTMDNHACSDHKMKNGDAAFLEIGTPIYAVKGYPSSLMVMADNKPYIADQNQKAKTAGELYPLQGLVKNIHIESNQDGSRIHTFSSTGTQKFLNEWAPLKLEDYDSLYKKKSFEEQPVFLEIELNNGVSFRLVYYPNSNTFHSGVIGNNEIKDIIKNEWSTIKGN
jgi:hypothetical protein